MSELIAWISDGSFESSESLMSISARVGSIVSDIPVLELSTKGGIKDLYRYMPHALNIVDGFGSTDDGKTKVLIFSGLRDAKKEPPPSIWIGMYELLVRATIAKNMVPILIVPPEPPDNIGLRGSRRWIRRARKKILTLSNDRCIQAIEPTVGNHHWIDSVTLSNEGYHVVATQISEAIQVE